MRALSISLRSRWCGAVCYTSQDLRSRTNAACLLARLRCPKKSAHPLVLDFLDRCAKKSSLPRPPDAVGFLAPRATLVGLIIEDREIKPCLYNKKSLTSMV